MDILPTIKKEITLQLAKYIPVKIKKGLCRGMRLYGNLFYNRRSHMLTEEETFYASIDYNQKIIIEAGACKGFFSMFFAKKAIGGKLFAFEPNPSNYFLLNKNLKTNNLTNSIPVNCGLSDSSGRLFIVSSRYNTGKSTFKEDKQASIKRSLVPIIEREVEVKTIDTIVDEFGLERVDFIKIDTEGWEPFVVRGMKKTLEKHLPLLYFEIHGLNEMQRRKDISSIYELLKQQNYRIFKLKDGFQEISNENLLINSGGGYVGVRKNSDLEVICSNP